MKIALIGYGKMGKAIAALAVERGHELITIDVGDSIDMLADQKPDVAIEFTTPEAAPNNIRWGLTHGIPVVCGTTGWLSELEQIKSLCLQSGGCFFYASNYSLGVNLFFKLNAHLAKLMAGKGYDVSIHEIHHTQKKDAPSGTAITLAEGIIKNNPAFTSWSQDGKQPGSIQITSERKDPYPGTHEISYAGKVDEIRIEHTAHSREGFASGALAVAEWLPGKQGILGMDDFLGIG